MQLTLEWRSQFIRHHFQFFLCFYLMYTRLVSATESSNSTRYENNPASRTNRLISDNPYSLKHQVMHSLQLLPVPTAVNRFWVATSPQGLPAPHQKDFDRGGFSGILPIVPITRLRCITFISYETLRSTRYVVPTLLQILAILMLRVSNG